MRWWPLAGRKPSACRRLAIAVARRRLRRPLPGPRQPAAQAPSRRGWDRSMPRPPTGAGWRWSTGASPADVGHLDRGRPDRQGGAQLGVAVATPPPDPGQRRAELVVAGTLAEQDPQVVPSGGKQAGVELAVGRQARPSAVAAKRLRHRRDHADLPPPIAEAPAASDLAAIVRL